jgi:hypothetical protein
MGIPVGIQGLFVFLSIFEEATWWVRAWVRALPKSHPSSYFRFDPKETAYTAARRDFFFLVLALVGFGESECDN